jgi:hypothetical protein
MFEIRLFVCMTLFMVDAFSMDAASIVNNDYEKRRLAHSTEGASQLNLNAKLHDSTKSSLNVKKVELEPGRTIDKKLFVSETEKKLEVARAKEKVALEQAEKERLLKEKRDWISGLTKGMSSIYQEIYRVPLEKVLSSNSEDKFITYYEDILKTQQASRGETTNRIVSINEALEKIRY